MKKRNTHGWLDLYDGRTISNGEGAVHDFTDQHFFVMSLVERGRRTCQVQKKIMPLASNCMKFGYISYNTINQSWKINTISQKIYCFLFLAKMYWKYTKNLTTPKKSQLHVFFILCSLNFVTYNLHNLRLAHWKRELKYIYLVVACFTESLIIF